MHTQYTFLRRQLQNLWKEHGHFVASLLCGLLLGSSFGLYIQPNQAAPDIQITVPKNAQTFQSERIVPRGEKVQEEFRFFTAQSVIHPSRFSLYSLSTQRSSVTSSAATVFVDVQKESKRSDVSVHFSSSAQRSSQSSVAASLSDPALRALKRVERMPASSATSSIPAEVVAFSSAPAVMHASSEARNADDFPPFGSTRYPVSKSPNWGAMKTPEEWNRTYGEMTKDDFVPLPRYDLAVLTTPMQTLLLDRDKNVAAITAKLFYSTRYMGTYDLDAGEHTGIHHPGIDYKLALHTPIVSIAGGRVYAVTSNDVLGKYVVVEHRKDGNTYFSIYGHLGSVSVTAGQDIEPGMTIGYIGMTGQTTAPHLHLEVNKGFVPVSWATVHGAAGSDGASLNPMTFIATGGNM
jgi:murein DD-endopeptidase MepM/ murein hydrolase activator NlpD